MENNKYCSTEISEETKDLLILLGFNELPYCIHKDEPAKEFIINKTKKQFWLNGCRALKHAQQMTKIPPITLKEIKQWETN